MTDQKIYQELATLKRQVTELVYEAHRVNSVDHNNNKMVIDENSDSAFDLADTIASLDARITALENK